MWYTKGPYVAMSGRFEKVTVHVTPVLPWVVEPDIEPAMTVPVSSLKATWGSVAE